MKNVITGILVHGYTLGGIVALWCLRLILLSWQAVMRTPSQDIIVVSACGAFGDLLCALPAINKICEYYHSKGWKVICITQSACREWVGQLALADEFIYSDNGGPWRFFHTMLRYKAKRMINLYERPSWRILAYSVTLPDSASMVVTLRPTDQRLHDGDVMLQRQSRTFIRKIFTHLSVEQKYLVWDRLYFYWARRCFDIHEEIAMGVPIQQSQLALVNKFCGTEMRVTFNGDGGKMNLPPPQYTEDYYIVVPGGSYSDKCWPEERFAQIIDRIYAVAPALTPVICGTSGERIMAQKIMTEIKSTVKILDLTGRSSLLQLFANVKNARFLIANDTGTAHIAPLFDIPQICIVAALNLGIFFPNPLYRKTAAVHAEMPCRGCRGFCHIYTPQEKLPCIKNIPIEAVWKEIYTCLLTPGRR